MESTPEECVEGLAIVRVLAAVLDRLVCANATAALSHPGQVTKFHAMKAPGIAIQQYLERIHKYASCSNECFILALIYIDRLIQRNNFLLTDLNVHRVVITAILLAAKFFDDAYYNNAYYAKVGGVLTPEINGLEVDFLFRINFSLYVTTDEFDKYRSELLTHLATVSPHMVVPQSPESQFYINPTTHHQSSLQLSPQITTPQYHHQQQHSQHHDSNVVAAATAALSAQVAIQQAYDRQQQQQRSLGNQHGNLFVNCNGSGNGIGMFHNDVVSDNLVHLASQITPSPPYPPIDMDSNPLINSILHNNSTVTEDAISAAANNNVIIQSLEFLQQTLDNTCINNNNGNNLSIGFAPLMTRTHSIPVKLGCGASSAQYYNPMTAAIINHTNATFSNTLPHSCPITSIPSRQPFPVPIEEQYLRLLVENTQQQPPHLAQSQPAPLHHHQQHMHTFYEDNFHRQHSMQQSQYEVQRFHSARLNDMVPTITMSSSPSGAYSNMLALQSEARRIAATQGQMLAAAGLSGPGF